MICSLFQVDKFMLPPCIKVEITDLMNEMIKSNARTTVIMRRSVYGEIYELHIRVTRFQEVQVEM